ncbi:MAG: hypothetical protein K2Q22_10705 [Cytophagales bacterium]|nr:hypothetical protein [Cytophagales bacterium]
MVIFGNGNLAILYLLTEVMDNENYEKFNRFRVNSILYDVEFEDDSILLVRPKFTFTKAFGFTLLFTVVYFWILAFDNNRESNKYFYMLTIPLIIKFLFELRLFLKRIEFRIDKTSKSILKNGKLYKEFTQIKSLILSNNYDEDNYLTYELEIVYINGIIFEIGETNDIRLYELGHKISKIIEKEMIIVGN